MRTALSDCAPDARFALPPPRIDNRLPGGFARSLVENGQRDGRYLAAARRPPHGNPRRADGRALEDRDVVAPMARLRRFLNLCLWLLAATALPAHAQWQTLPAPWQAPPGNYVVNPTFAVLDAASPPGRFLFTAGRLNDGPVLYRSGDDGLSWQVMPVGGYTSPPRWEYDDPAIYWVGTVPGTQGVLSHSGDLYITVGTGGYISNRIRCDLLRSSDAGASWNLVAHNIDACVIVANPSAPLVVYGLGLGQFGSDPPVLYRSRDEGSSWQNVGQTLPSMPTGLRVAADGTLYALTGAVYVSSNQGDTWTTALSWPATDNFVAKPVATNDLVTRHHPVYGDRFAIIATSNGLYRTTDAGATWLAAGLQGFTVNFLDPVDDPASVELQVRIGYRRGLALLRGETIVSLTNGLPLNIDPVPKDGRYALSSAGLSICADPQSCAGGTLPDTATLIEYHNTLLDHYFMTLDATEADGIDHGAAGPGWSRTGVTFEVYRDLTATPLGYWPVCRFYGTPGIGPNSHFFTINPQECANVQADPGWRLESASAFVAVPPDSRYIPARSTFEYFCSTGRAVYRLYNNRFAQNDSNHRYVTDLALYWSLQAQGWTGEGLRLCVLR
jgi:Repeat of unknown function (DUF5648)